MVTTLAENAVLTADQLKRNLRRRREDLEDLCDEAQRGARRAARRADGLVRDHPWETAGAGLALGLLAGAALAILALRR